MLKRLHSNFDSHLPAILLASFIKRLSLLSLNAPPAAIIMIIPFTYNVLKRHPALMVMIHRAPEGDDDATFAGTSFLSLFDLFLYCVRQIHFDPTNQTRISQMR